MKKQILPIVLLVLSVKLFAQNMNAWLDYPIDYAQLTGVFSGPVTAKMLLESGTLLNRTNDNGDRVICKIDKKTRKGNTVTYLLTTSAAGKPVVKFVIRLKINDSEESALLSYFKMNIVSSGNLVESEYDGTEESAGKVWGMLLEAKRLQFIFDVDKFDSMAGNATQEQQ